MTQKTYTPPSLSKVHDSMVDDGILNFFRNGKKKLDFNYETVMEDLISFTLRNKNLSNKQILKEWSKQAKEKFFVL